MHTGASFWSLVVEAPTAVSSLTLNFRVPNKDQVMPLAKDRKIMPGLAASR